MVYRGPIYSYFLALILTPSPIFPKFRSLCSDEKIDPSYAFTQNLNSKNFFYPQRWNIEYAQVS